MTTIVILIHVLVAFALIVIVLLQTGKGASMGAIFGGSSQALFGPMGASTFLGKLTTVAAAVFMITSLLLAIFWGSQRVKSVVTGGPAGTPPGKSFPAPAIPPAGSIPRAPTAPPAK